MANTPPTPSYRVLLVDNDYRTSNRLADLLRDDGFEVDVVRDGAAAIAHLGRSPQPDTLITELTMRFADGVSVARYARAQRPGLQVVVLTAYPTLLRPGAMGSPPPLVLTKPLDYAQLLAALRAPKPASGESFAPVSSSRAKKC